MNVIGENKVKPARGTTTRPYFTKGLGQHGQFGVDSTHSYHRHKGRGKVRAGADRLGVGPGSPAWEPAPGALGLGAALLPKRGAAAYWTDLTEDHGANAGSRSQKVHGSASGGRARLGEGCWGAPGCGQGRGVCTPRPQRGLLLTPSPPWSAPGRGAFRGPGRPSPLRVEPRPPAPRLRAKLDRGALAK